MFVMVIDFVIVVGAIVGAVLKFDKDWFDFAVCCVIGIHSLFHLSTHFRRRFIDKWKD